MSTHAQRTVVPAAHGAAVMLPANTEFAVVNLEGGQIGDLFAFNAQDSSEFASASHTRSMLRKLFPLPGDSIYTNRKNAILRFVADNSPGRHDALYAACDPRRYELMGGAPDHRSCAMNLDEAMAQFGGLKCPTPEPFNLFQEVTVDNSGNIPLQPASARPGDNVVFTTLMDAIVAVSSCPMDLYDANSGGITPLAIDY
jgi:uncharacterized protein